MKIEKLKKFNLWKWVGVMVIICVLCVVVTFKATKAKYRFTASYPAAYGTIHWKTGDLEVLAVNIENSSGEYENSDTIPTSGYVLNETESYCGLSNGDGTYTHDTTITINYHDGVIGFDNITKKGTKCFLYFDKDPCNGGTACQAVLAYNEVDSSRVSGEFTSTFTDDTAGKIFQGPADDYGDTTYFFAGANPNNWVYFAGFYWRIIRINGDGTARLIYNGTGTDTTGTATQLSSKSAFNSSYKDNMYVGYMYTSGSVHGLGTSSTIKGVLDSWYSSNLKNFASYIDTNVGFCGDRQPSTSKTELNGSGGTGTTTTYYGAYIRAYSTYQFTYQCAESSDLYTTSSSSYGNKALMYPIGLITVDEAAFAGGFADTSNEFYWLYTDQTYWTMSPCIGSEDWVFNVYSDGSIDVWYPINSGAVRPVINLKSDTVLTGSGTSSDPFVVV